MTPLAQTFSYATAEEDSKYLTVNSNLRYFKNNALKLISPSDDN